LGKGSGTFAKSVVTQNGGKVRAGNSPGKAAFGNFVFGPGGGDNCVFAIDDAARSAGPSPDALGHVSGWGLVQSTGTLTWAAMPAAKLTVALETLVNPTAVGIDLPGPMDLFDPARAYRWPAVEWAGTYSGPADAATLTAVTEFDTTGFLNPVAGTFGWALDPAGHTLSLTYTPTAVPEPGGFLLVGGTEMGWLVRRRCRSSRPRT
jgi:hypothetical protein